MHCVEEADAATGVNGRRDAARACLVVRETRLEMGFTTPASACDAGWCKSPIRDRGAG